eukprot:201200-Rhodomonas_salina.2
MSGTDIGCPAPRWREASAVLDDCLQKQTEALGTNTPIVLRIRDALSGTDLGFAHMSRMLLRDARQAHSAICLGPRYAMPGTDMSYGGARAVVEEGARGGRKAEKVEEHQVPRTAKSNARNRIPGTPCTATGALGFDSVMDHRTHVLCHVWR